jgi:ABC-type transporter Mla subunit MlaD
MKNDMHLLDEAEQHLKYSITQLRSIQAENNQMQQNIDTLIRNASELIKAIDKIRMYK